jgi:integrase
MRVAKMGYTQRVTKRDKNGRVTSSFLRVRIVVPDGLSSSLPAPYTSNKNLTKKTSTDREAAEWTARFLAMIDQAAGRTTAYKELVGLDSLSVDDLIRRSPAVLTRFFQTLNLPTPAVERARDPVRFEWMIDKWAKHTNAPKKGVQNMTTKCGDFREWLGTNNPQAVDDMARVTFENCRDYRDFLIGGELSPGTIANHLKALNALFRYAFDNYPDEFPVNQMARIKYQAGDAEERDDFTPEERARILTAAREAGPVIRWLNWLSSFNGGRLSELVEADTRDIVMKEGIWVMEIKKTIRIPDQRRKTRVSARDAPLHSALLAEGFLEYVQAIKKEYGDGPLFPQVTLDAYGRRNGKVSKPISKWLRNVVGIRDPNKPFHSHRHTATSFLRNTRLPDGSPAVKEDVERYLLGHSGKGAHAGYGKQWIETLKAAIEVIPDPLHAVKDGASAGS